MTDRHIRPWKKVFTLFVLLSGQVFAANPGNVQLENGPTPEVKQAMVELKASLAMKNFPAALIEARQVVMLLNNSNPVQTQNQAVAFHNLAKVQQLMGLYYQSEKSYLQSIRLVEGHHGVYADELLGVLGNLGSLYVDTADYQLAIESFRRAQHITHRNQGVYALGQLKFINWITLLDVKSGRARDADKQQRFYYTINEKNFGENDPRMLPVMNKMADWFASTGQLTEALRTYKKALAVIEEHALGEIEKLYPLRGLSTVTYLKGSCCTNDLLAEALRIVETDDGSDHVDELDALVHLADMNMIRKKRGKAKKYYQQAWRRLGGKNPLTATLFSTPELLGVSRVEDVYKAYYETVEGRSRVNKIIYRVPNQEDNSPQVAFRPETKTPETTIIGEPLSLCHSQALELAHTRDSQKLEQYFVDLNFTVTSDGGVRNVSLMESNAPARLQRYVTNTLRQVRYRPTLKEGETVATDNITLRQTFSNQAGREAPKAYFNRTSSDGRRAVSLGCRLIASRG